VRPAGPGADALFTGRSLDVERVIDLIATTAERALCR
jgi:hypothetical protein